MRLIDADVLANFIDYGHLNNPNEKLYSENDIREMIDMMPTVDAVPVRHGHWIEQWRTADTRMLRCSECKMVFNVGNGREGNYCPNCGAMMGTERREE